MAAATSTGAAASTLLDVRETYTSVTDRISAITLQRRFGRLWWGGLLAALALTLLLTFGVGWLLAVGVGIWGINIPVAWSFAIADYVWWIAIGMGGTFISAALYLRQTAMAHLTEPLR